MNLKKNNTVSTADDTSATNGRDNSGKQKESLLPTTDFERLGDSVRGAFSFGDGISPARNSISRRRKSNIAPNNNVMYYWPDEEIALAEEISKESQRFIFGYLERPPRSDTRTSTDNRIDMAAYLNNQETWKIVSSKLMFFMASVMAMLAMLTVYLASYASSGEELSLTVREHISREGSLSSMWREQAAANRLNQAFMVCSSLLMFLSNFGFYLLPRWENEQTFAKHDNKKGWCFFQCLQNLVCFNSYKRIEATSNWVVGEEGLFKLIWQTIFPTSMLILAMVPLPVRTSENQETQRTVHMISGMGTFTIYSICELYQLIRGERMFARSTGAIQIGRFVCMVCSIACIFVYMGTSVYPKSRDSWAAFFSATFETAALMFMLTDMMLICLIPIKAEQSVFALGGYSSAAAFRQKECHQRSTTFRGIDEDDEDEEFC